MGRLFTKKWKFLIFWGPHSHPSSPIDVKFCPAKRSQVPVGNAKFDHNRCDESPLRGEKPDFWSVSKNNTGSLPLGGILPVKISNQISRMPNHNYHYVDGTSHPCLDVAKTESARQRPHSSVRRHDIPIIHQVTKSTVVIKHWTPMSIRVCYIFILFTQPVSDYS